MQHHNFRNLRFSLIEIIQSPELMPFDTALQ